MTVGVPTFNRPRLLARALDSLLAQTYRNLRVVISDDGSKDGTADVCRAYARKDARVEHIRQDRNLGPEANFRYLMDAATGPYFMWLSDDDVLDPEFVAETVTLLEADPRALLAFTDYRIIDEDDSWVQDVRLDHLYPTRPWADGMIDLFQYPYSRSTVVISGVYRLAALREVGDPKPSTFRRILSGHEAPFLARIAARGRVVVSPRILFARMGHFRSKSNSAHTVSNALAPWELAMLYASIEARLFMIALGADVPVSQRVRLARATVRASFRKVKELLSTGPKKRSRPTTSG